MVVRIMNLDEKDRARDNNKKHIIAAWILSRVASVFCSTPYLRATLSPDCQGSSLHLLEIGVYIVD